MSRQRKEEAKARAKARFLVLMVHRNNNLDNGNGGFEVGAIHFPEHIRGDALGDIAGAVVAYAVKHGASTEMILRRAADTENLTVGLVPAPMVIEGNQG